SAASRHLRTEHGAAQPVAGVVVLADGLGDQRIALWAGDAEAGVADDAGLPHAGFAAHADAVRAVLVDGYPIHRDGQAAQAIGRVVGKIAAIHPHPRAERTAAAVVGGIDVDQRDRAAVAADAVAVEVADLSVAHGGVLAINHD